MGMYKSFQQFFRPNGSGVLAAGALTSAAVHGEFICVRSCDLRRLMAAITTAVANDANQAVVTFKKRSAPGVTSGEVSVGALTFVDGLAVGKVVYKDIDPVKFRPGEVLAIEVTTAGTDGFSAAGGAVYGFEVVDTPEEAANESNMVLSA